MPDYNELVKAIKQAGSEAVEARGPAQICFGKVTSASPLQILVDQKMTLGAAQLVLTRNVTEHEILVTVEWETEKELSGHTHTIEGKETEETNLEHMHEVTGKKKVLIHNALLAGEEVILLRQQGGQKYIIIDRVG